MKGALWKLPDEQNYTNDIEDLVKIFDIDTTIHGSDLKTIIYHPMEGSKAVAVVDNNFVLWDLAESLKVFFYYFLRPQTLNPKLKVLSPKTWSFNINNH